MGLQAVTVEQFPGLDLRTDPGDSRGALDAMNVTVEAGLVRTRDGFLRDWNSGTNLVFGAPTLMAGSVDNIPFLVTASSGSTNNTNFTYADGTQLAGSLGSLPNVNALIGASGVAIGTPTAQYYYMASGNGLPQRFNLITLAWTATAFPTSTRVVTVSPTDNRLMLCSNNLVLGSKVAFSDPGAPDTFGANNYVLLNPGDGEDINGAVVFNNQTFIFKNTKFYVFYGNSIDATGNPVFNYRVVNTGIGMAFYCPQSVCVGPDAVYFVGNDGIYKTAGGPPVCISHVLDPFFRNSSYATPYWTGSAWDITTRQARIAWFNDCLYVSLATSSTTGVTLVWDSRFNTWTIWSIWPGMLATYQFLTSVIWIPRLAMSPMAPGATGLYHQSLGVTADNGVNFASRYRLPFENYGSTGQKRIRETILEGTGTPTVRWSDDWGALSTGSAVALAAGVGAAPAVGRQRLAQRGRAFSLQLEKASGGWSVNRLQVNVSDSVRKPEITS